MKKTKFAAIATAIFIALLLLSGTAMAFSGSGSGTPASPFQITSVSQFKEINDSLTGSYILMNDIEITDPSWNAIGNSRNSFTGTFNGSNHTITFNTTASFTKTDGYLPYNDGYGLFGNIAGTGKIENLQMILKSDLMAPGNNVGLIAGSMSGTSAGSPASIVNCFVQIEGISSLAGSESVGGLVGIVYNGTIVNSRFNGSVVANNSTGGLVGNMSSGSVINSHAVGTVTAKKGMAGGLVGQSSGNLSNSYFTGSVSSEEYDVGGLVGSVSSGSISECYSSGTVRGNENVGGLLGYVSGGTIKNTFSNSSVTGSTSVGGLVGRVRGGTLNESYSAGTVPSSGTNVSGLVGRIYSSGVYINNCYYDSEISGKSDADKGTPQTTADMKKSSTFTNWAISTVSLEKIWYIYEDENYPQLSALHQPETISSATTIDLKHIGSEEIRKDADGNTKYWSMDANYILVENINMFDVDFMPIGTFDNPFTGTFKGAEDRNYAISNLNIDLPDTDNVGLFGYTKDAVFSNIHLIDAAVSGNENVGLLIGYADGTTAVSTSSVAGSVNTAGDHAGGFIGFLSEGSLIQCYSDADVSADSEAGGLVGEIGGGLISECYATGSVSAQTKAVGGLIGTYGGLLPFSIERSFALNEFVEAPESAGKVVGFGDENAAEFAEFETVYAWADMPFGTDGFEDGTDISSSEVWNTFSADSVWTNSAAWDSGIWILCAEDLFMLPIFSLQSDITADASHLKPSEETGSTTVSRKGGSTGSAQVHLATENDIPAEDDVPAESTESGAGSSNVDPNPVSSIKTPSKTGLFIILGLGVAIVIGAVFLFVRGRP